MVCVTIVSDDFGYCVDRNRGIIECFKSGHITKTSLLVNAFATEKAVRDFKNLELQDSELKIGLHLNLTEGRPVSDIRKIPSLVNNSGFLHGKFGLREKICKQEVNLEEVELEIAAQIQYFKELLGYFPSYVDGHNHVHVLPFIRQAFVLILQKFEIQNTRLPFEINLDNCSWLSSNELKFFKEVCRNSEDSLQALKHAKMCYADYFMGLSTTGSNMQTSNVSNVFKQILEDIEKNGHCDEPVEVEFMVHPGLRNQSGKGGCGEGPDDFALSPEREHELNCIVPKDPISDSMLFQVLVRARKEKRGLQKQGDTRNQTGKVISTEILLHLKTKVGL
eukprot:gene14005-15463_t